MQNVERGEYLYEGGPATLEFVTQYILDEGPFDGLWAFSQVETHVPQGLLLAFFVLLPLPTFQRQAQIRRWQASLFSAVMHEYVCERSRLCAPVTSVNKAFPKALPKTETSWQSAGFLTCNHATVPETSRKTATGKTVCNSLSQDLS